jgi:hypothetical protein
MEASSSELERSFGPESVSKMTAAYEHALLELMYDEPHSLVPRETRLALVTAILAEARQGRFEPEQMTEAALAVARRVQAAPARVGITPILRSPAPPELRDRP